MVRTQIQLTEKQARWIRASALREGVSMAEVIRRLVDRARADQKPRRADRYARAARWVGAYSGVDPAPDLSERHDDYLDEAYGAGFRPNVPS